MNADALYEAYLKAYLVVTGVVERSSPPANERQIYPPVSESAAAALGASDAKGGRPARSKAEVQAEVERMTK